jgi:hypothetical protein
MINLRLSTFNDVSAIGMCLLHVLTLCSHFIMPRKKMFVACWKHQKVENKRLAASYVVPAQMLAVLHFVLTVNANHCLKQL